MFFPLNKYISNNRKKLYKINPNTAKDKTMIKENKL